MGQSDKPRLALNNITAGVREREDANSTREARCRDEIQGVVGKHTKLTTQWAVGFIDWLDDWRSMQCAEWCYVPNVLNASSRLRQKERKVSRNAPAHGGIMRAVRARSKKKYTMKATMTGKANRRRSEEATTECETTRA
jgi:hypothetical protein